MQTITRIEKQKNKQDRVNIYLDEEFFCGMQNFVCVKYGLKVGDTISKERLQDLMMESDREQAMNKVSKLLQHGLKTEKQVREYLVKQGYDEMLQHHVLSKLKEYGFVNDVYYVTSYVNTYKNKYGIKKMQYELFKKGVGKKIVEDVLENFESDEEVLLKLATKHIKSKERTYENLQKTASYLVGKGFTWDEVKVAIDNLKTD